MSRARAYPIELDADGAPFVRRYVTPVERPVLEALVERYVAPTACGLT